jgi:hypothetical protein
MTTSISDSRIILKCVKEKNKLRIKFHCFIDFDGNHHYNVYNNEYNCMFPRDIRENECFYQVGIDDIELIDDKKKKPFYKIRQSNIVVLGFDNNLNVTSENIKVFDNGDDCIGECVICMCETSSVIFLPCAHRCTCVECYSQLKKNKYSNKCPLCRRTILNVV